MNDDQVKLLMNRIKELQEELKDNPQYTQDIVASIIDDIQYYQNQIDFICIG